MTLVSITISQLLACPPILTRVDLTLVNLPVAEPTSVPGVASTGEVIDTIDTDSVEAVVAGAVIVVPLATVAREAFRAVTGEGAAVVMADPTVVAGVGGAVVNVDLAVGATKPINTGAVIGIDTVSADPIVTARVGGTLVYISLAVLPTVAWHAYTSELSSPINTGALIHTRVAVTLVHIHLTPRPCVPLWTPTLVRPRSVHTLPLMLTRSSNSCTLINILLTGGACVARRTGAGSLPSHRVGVTSGSRVARVPQTLIFQVAEKTSLPKRTLALIPPNLVMAGTSIETRASCTVIFVLFTILANKPVNTDALVSTLRILASAMVLARIVQGALVNIFQAVATCPVGRALAGIGVSSIDTPPTILAQIAFTVVNVLLAVPTLESIRAGAIVLIVSCSSAKASIFTGRRAAWHIRGVTVLPSPAILAVALVSTVEILAASVLARVGLLKALIHVDVTVGALKAFLARAFVCILH